MRVLGGRSLSWGRQSYRMGDIDFRCADRDGYGQNWGIRYEDLAPYYEKVERYIGISGIEEGLEQLPDSVFQPPDAIHMRRDPFPKSVARKDGSRGDDRPLRDHHQAGTTDASHANYCGPCEQGCVTHSYYNSLTTTLKAALDTGSCDLLTDAAVASHVIRDARTGNAAGVAYVDRMDRAAREVRGEGSRVVCLNARVDAAVDALRRTTAWISTPVAALAAT